MNAWQRSSASATGKAITLLGINIGSDGAVTSATSGKNIVIGNGATVKYTPGTPDLSTLYGDFRIKQGSNMTIGRGAVWEQLVQASWPVVPWTEMDASNLVLNGGTVRRSGEAGGVGGGLLLLGSKYADDNFSQLPAPAIINILLKNGGRIEHQGDLWFGSGNDTRDDGLRVSMKINNGVSGLDGALFSNYFTLTNSLGVDNYTLTSLIGAGVAGDYNDDGVVNAVDFVIWRNNVGTNNALPDDPHGGTIGVAQCNQWRFHFGQTAGSGTLSIAVVPEPASATLLILGAVAGLLRGDRKV